MLQTCTEVGVRRLCCGCVQAEPGNKEVRALLARYKKESAAANKRDAKMFKVCGLHQSRLRGPALTWWPACPQRCT